MFTVKRTNCIRFSVKMPKLKSVYVLMKPIFVIMRISILLLQVLPGSNFSLNYSQAWNQVQAGRTGGSGSFLVADINVFHQHLVLQIITS